MVRNQRGATLVEFGFVAFPLCLVIMGIGDLAYQSYLNAVTKGVLDRAARAASVGTLNATQIDSFISNQMSTVMSKQATVSVVKTSYYNFSRIGKPEKILTDTAPLGSYNSGDCFEDANGNGTYDTSSGSAGLGGADDIVYYQVNVSMPRLFPMAKLLGWPATQTATSSVILRNQPWANQAAPAKVCS
ncbi:TadE/TadG family type IV pilus assembly protein [Sphingobium sp.]|uniref:TadE/TadG family type IV pilus assembly protein n=1 Tax=Sphingobium sp. TaxID=1912891 RepID=UPI002D80FD68|nr:TadE/TadG family type IV pilus assembly protein [Sphingobium sp.]